jgi:hypothetical protein
MTVQYTINAIAAIIADEFEGKILLATPIKIKKSPPSLPVVVHGVEINDHSGVMILNKENQWQKLDESTADANIISNSVLQRIKSLSSVNSDKRSTS